MAHHVRPSRPVALVAGASRGLGWLIARELLRRGHDVAICARDAEETERGAELLRGEIAGTTDADARVAAYPCDVADADGVAELVRRVEGDLGPVEVAIHVAGIIQVGPAETMTLDHFDQAIDVMLRGPIHLAWAVLPGMRTRGRGRYGVVTSIGGKVAPPHLLPYSAAKFGAVGFTEGLAAELQGTGVTATALVPGLMRTGSHENALFTGDHEAEYAWFSAAASLPVLAMDAERAAARMVRGVLNGEPVVLLSPLAHVGTRVHGLLPGLTVRVMGLSNRLLPKPSGASDESTTVRGRDAGRRLDSPVLRTLTTLGRHAAARYNERFRGDYPEA